MPSYITNSGKDFSLARKTQMSVSMFGQLQLTARNLIPDPAIRSFEPNGYPTYWSLDAPPVRTSRNVYIGAKGERLTAQNATPLPVEQNAYFQKLALLTGWGLPSSKPARDYLSAAQSPALGTRPGSKGGYPQGDYPVSYAWIVGSLYDKRYRALTNPAPPLRVPLAEGQSYEIPLPQERAENALGLAILQGEPDGPDNVLYVQEVVDIRSFMPPSRVMDGPLRTAWRAPQTNNTYCGAFWSLPGPRIKKTYGVRRLYPMRVRCSFKFRTDIGVSASQGYTDKVVLKEQPKSALRFWFPRLPARAIAIVPQIQAPSSEWYDLDYGLRGGDVPIIPGWDWHPYFFTDDPEKEGDLVQYEGAERSMTDETGIPGPETAIEEARSFGLARLSAARYAVRTTDVYDFPGEPSVESPPSALREIETGTDEELVVDFREFAEEGNVIPNADFEDRDPDGSPRRYTFTGATSSSLLSVTARRSVVHFDDSTERTNNEAALDTGLFRISPEDVYTVRSGVRFDRRVGGTAQTAIYFYNENQQTINSFGVFNLGSDGDGERTCGPPGSGAAYETSVPAYYARIMYRLIGNDTVGARNLAGRFVHTGLFRGEAAPRKVVGDLPVAETEPEEEAFPEGSYMTVVENPSWTNGKGNGFEYYGSSAAVVRRRYFANGFWLPVTPNRTYTLQCEYSYTGVAVGTELLPITIKDRDDRTTQNLGFAASREQESDPAAGSGTFTVVIETGPDDTYLLINPSSLGPGLVRAWGFQLEMGMIATAWSDAHAASGSAAATFRTVTPGLEHRPHLARRLYGITSFTDFGAVAEVPDGTSVEIRARSRAREEDEWSDYVTSISELPNTEIVEVEVQAQTTDLTISPEISDIYLRADPPRPVLLREDGSEYHGGILIEGLPATGFPENTEEEPRLNQTRRIKEMYAPEPDLVGLTFRAISDIGASQAMYDAAHGNRQFVIEGRGMRRLVRIVNIRFGANRKEKIGEGLYVHVASDVSAQILAEEPLDAGVVDVEELV